MSDTFYRVVRFIGRSAFWVSSSPVMIGAGRVPAAGPCILACTHQSPYDVPLLIRHTPRLLDFVSIVEVFRNPLVAWFYGSLNAFPLDRSRADPKTVRIILRRLQRGRVVAVFPEGGFRGERDSVVRTRRMRSGVGRIAQMSGAPVVPCVLIGSSHYARLTSWLPLRRTRYGLIYGEPIEPSEDADDIEARLVDALVTLYAELCETMGERR